MTLVYNCDMDKDGVSSIKQVAERLGVNPRTVLREIERGKLAARKVGRKYVFFEQDIKDYLSGGVKDLDKLIKEFCQDKKHEMVTLLQKLVAVPSESETGGEENLARFVKSEMDRLGIGSVIYGKGEAVTVQGTFGYADEGILLDCPLDATPAGDINKWIYPPYGGVISGGKMYGRGTADCKAGMVAMIYAVLALKNVVDRNKLRVELVFDGGEQNGAYLGMKSALKRGLPVGAGIIGYAGDNKRLAIGARGYHRFTFTAHGNAVHTGSSSKTGVNAISQMAKFILEMESQKFPASGDRYFPFGSRLTFAMIEGGRAINIVPDECIARLDVRVVPSIGKKQVEEMIEKAIERMKKRDPDFVMEYRYDVGQEGYVIKENEKVVGMLLSSIKGVLAKSPELIANGPAHIGNLLFESKIPVVVWGPEGANVHSYDEYVEIDSIPKTAEVYAGAILRYFGL